MQTPNQPSVRRRRAILIPLVHAAVLSCCLAQGSVSPAPAPASPDDQEVVALSEFNVATRRDADEWTASEAVSGTRTVSTILELPFAVQVLTREFMETFQLKDLDEFGLYISGFAAGEVEAGGGGGSRMRGFVPPNYRNGFPRSGVSEVMNVDRVEVIKGPLSALYGRAEPGGLVNFITRKARSRPGYRLAGTLGSETYRRGELEATGPVTDRLFYRVDASYQYFEGNMDYFFQRTRAASTSWTYRFRPDSALTLDLEYMYRDSNTGTSVLGRRASVPIVRTDGSAAVAPQLILGPWEPLINFNVWGPDSIVTREVQTANLQFEHRIDKVWSIRLNGQGWERYVMTNRWSSPQYQINTGKFNARSPFRQTLPQDSVAFQADVLAAFRTGAVEHKVLVTFDYSDTSQHTRDYAYGNGTGGTPNDLAALPAATTAIDPLNPVWVPLELSKFTRQTRDQKEGSVMKGSFISERMSLLSGRLILMGGIRYDEVHVTFEDAITPRNNVDSTADNVTGTAGLTWRIAKDRLVAFANYSQSFNGDPIFDAGVGGFVGFSEGEGMEAGFKGLLLPNNSLSYTLTAYEIEKTNPAQDPDFVVGSGLPQYQGLRLERVSGVELDFNWRVSRALTLRGGVAVIDSEVVEAPEEVLNLTTRTVVGERLLRTPDLTANLAVNWNVPFVRGLSVGMAASYIDDVIIDYGNRLTTRIRQENPSYMLLNASAAYAFRTRGDRLRHTVRLNGLNLTDKYYWTVTGREAARLQVRGSYSLTW